MDKLILQEINDKKNQYLAGDIDKFEYENYLKCKLDELNSAVKRLMVMFGRRDNRYSGSIYKIKSELNELS